MPNGVKYSTTTPTGALRRGNVALGVTSNLGPTANTGFYSMPAPQSGKYIINKVSVSGIPNFFAPADDIELIRFARIEGATGADTGSAAAVLAWMATQPNLEAVNFEYENIVTNGLVYLLDAGFVSSYPTIGTTWYDLSGNNNNGTLINNPTFNSANSGSIVFDGIDDYTSTTSSPSLQMSSNITLCVWFKIPQNGLPYRQCLIGKYYWEYELGIYPNGGVHTYTASGNVCNGTYDEGIYAVNPLGDWVANTWYHLSWTLSGANEICYLNGSSIGTFTKNNSGTCSAGSNPVRIGTRGGPGDLQFSGNIPIAQIYNRTLSASEILQNYNAQKGRFGL